MTRYGVWTNQINADYFEVEAKDKAEARIETRKEWSRRYGCDISYIEEE